MATVPHSLPQFHCFAGHKFNNIFILLISFLITLNAYVVSTDVSVHTENYNKTKSKNVSDFLEEIKHLMKTVPIVLEETGNTLCDEHLLIFREGLQNAEPWAFQMADASSKLLDGMYEGHMINLGNFQECISASAPGNTFKGKYCLSLVSVGMNTSIYELLNYMDWHAFPSQYFKTDHSLMFGPQIAMCVPSSCTAKDVKKAADVYMRKNNISALMIVEDKACSTNEYESLDISDWIAIGILCLFILVALYSTYYDLSTKDSEHRKDVLVSFSLYTNWNKLMSSQCDQYLHNLHGIRFITSIWIMLAHVHMSVMSTSANIIRGIELLEGWDRLIISNSFLSVDTFLMLSGILLCFSFMNSHKNKKLKEFNLPLFYFARYVRLTPVLALLVMLSATVERHLGSGPIWNVGINDATAPCRDYWWIPLLYIQNYLNTTTCVTQAWYLAVDFQLYIISPILLILIWKKPKIGMAFLIFLVFAGMGIIFGIAFAYKEHLSFIEMGREVTGTEGENTEMDTAFQRNKLFVKTHARFPPWVIGIILGYILHIRKDRINIFPKTKIVAGWITSICLLLFSIMYGHRLLLLGYEYNLWECSIYLAVHRVTWSLGVAWVIFACAMGYGGIVNWILSLKVWLPLSRLVYCMYLMHSFILQMMRFTTTDSRNTTATETITTLIALFIASTVVSVIVSLMFESPFIALLNILFRGGSAKRIKTLPPKNRDTACNSA